jgi:predicted phage replisome organizer
MADVKWIKITTDIFDDEKILLIESMPDSNAVIVVWFKLLCLAGKQNNSGVFMLNDKIPYTEKMLSTIFRMNEATVTMALKTFEQFGMIEIIDGVITIPNWGKHQSLDQLEERKEYMKNYMQNYRQKQKAISCKVNSKVNSKVNVNSLEEELDKDIEKNKIKKHKYGEYANVLLSDEELSKLKSEFSDWEERIEKLSIYMASTGKRYKSHLATIRNWARKEEKPKQTATVYEYDPLDDLPL